MHIMIWIAVFILSFAILYWAGSGTIKGLMKMAKFLGWREFVVAFFIMAFAGCLPNLFIDLNAVINGMPELALGDVVGGNLVDLTLAVALAVLVGGKPLSVESRMVQTSTVFTAIIALLPWLLVLDKYLGRGDAIILFLTFIVYIIWLFSKEERFKKIYQERKKKKTKLIIQFISFIKSLFSTIVCIVLLLLASWGVIKSVQVFSETFFVSIPLIGILIIGLANTFPETYFSIVSAKKGQTWMILGDLMGSVIVCATLVLGIVAMVHPIEIADFSPFMIARIFLIIAAVFFFIFVKTGIKVTRTEAAILLSLYFICIFAELAFQ